MSDAILVEGIEVYAHHGATDEEQKIGHRYYIDAVVEADLSRAGQSDALEDTISYSTLARFLAAEATAHRFRLLEKLAAHLCEAALREFPTVSAITLIVGKRLPPAKLVVENAAVRIRRERQKV